MKKIRFGNPIATDSIVNFDNIETIEKKDIVSFLKIENKKEFRLDYKMSKHDFIYGLGENIGGINKRGGYYESFCHDNFDHTPDAKSIYAAHNLIIIDGEYNLGLFIDHPGKVAYDVGFTDKNILTIKAEKADLDLYIIEGESTKVIVKQLRKAIGQSYVPPKWAFGFQQSRWSYPTAETIREVADNFEKYDIPCDSIYLDIDYMDNYKNFTLNKKDFKNFPEFVSEMKNKGIRLIPIIDAGCKIEEGYEIYDEGVEKGYYCTFENGKPYVGSAWPGKVHFPDFLKPEARKWFGDKYKYLIDQGIDGFWNDMNEPAIFYSEAGLNKAFDKVEEAKKLNLDINSFFDLQNAFGGIGNRDEDYKDFYHNVDGKLVNHYDVHNLYGYNMTRAASESMADLYPNKRFLLFSRASITGMHRYGGIWTGDNKSWWEHLLLNIKMMPSINMLGFLYSGADIGGFASDSNAELLIRWTQFGVFTPLLRNHAGLNSRMQEPYAFDDDTTNIMRSTIQFRYAMIPYIYSEFMKSVLNDESYFKPLAFEYDDEMSKRTETQLLVGDSLMIAPIYEANSYGRNVWLPEEMLLWRIKDYLQQQFEIIKQGHSYISAEVDEIPLFIRKNKIMVIGNHAKNVDSLDNREISIVGFVDMGACYTLYDDDGSSDSYKNGDSNEILFSIQKNDSGKFETSIKTRGSVGIDRIKYTIVSMDGKTENGVIEVQ